MHRIASILTLALVAGMLSTSASAQQTTSFGTGQEASNILGSLMGRLADLEEKHSALARKVSRMGSAAAPADTAALAALEGQIAEINTRLTALEAALDGKADIGQLNVLVAHINAVFEGIDERLVELEGVSSDSTAIDDIGRRVSELEDAEDTQAVVHVYTSDLNAIVGMGIVGRLGDPAMDQYMIGGELQVFGRLLWPLPWGSMMTAAGIEVVTSPYGSGQGVSVAGLPTLMVADLVGFAAGPVYYCDGLWGGPSGCSASRGGGLFQVSGDLPIEPLGLRVKVGIEGLSTKLVGDKGEEARAFFGLDGYFGSSGR